MEKQYRNWKKDGGLFESSLPKLDSGLCTRTQIHVYTISQVSVYKTIGHLVHLSEDMSHIFIQLHWNSDE